MSKKKPGDMSSIKSLRANRKRFYGSIWLDIINNYLKISDHGIPPPSFSLSLFHKRSYGAAARK